MPKSKIKVSESAIPIISLFSGCGGFDLGFTEEGFTVTLALDIDSAAVKSYNHNHLGGRAKECDLAATSGQDIIGWIEKMDLPSPPRGVIGGSPCQSFSAGNVHFKATDKRHSLPRKYAAILKSLNARYKLDFFVFENVQGITSRKHQETFNEFKVLFEDAGFVLTEGLLDAVNFAVPQRRPRVFVVGLNKEKYKGAKYAFPVGDSGNPKSVASVIKGLKEPVFFRRGISSADIPVHENHWTMMPKSDKFKSGFLKEGEKIGRSFRVLSWDNPSWTVAYGHREIHIHPSGTRRLSVYEAMLLQGLPKSYVLKGNLSQQIRQVSDMVPSQVGAAIARSIRQLIDQQTGGPPNK